MAPFRAAALALLLLAVVVARVEAADSLSLGANPSFWLRAYDSGGSDRLMIEAWGVGVREALQLVVESYGCNATGVSGRALAAATADLIRQEKPTPLPLAAAVIAYGRLSGCEEALERGLRFNQPVLR
jgi:hypothetical protein